MKRKFFYLLLLPLFLACQETFDYYIGIPLQPELEENSYKDGLNILGILRPDSINGHNMSFVHVQKILPAVGQEPDADLLLDTTEIKKVSALISWYESGIQKELALEHTNQDSIFEEEQFRPTLNFTPDIGIEYSLSCELDGFPVLTSTAILPNRPRLTESGINYENGVLQFEIESDTSAYLYDVYLSLKEQTISKQRIKPNHTENSFTSFGINRKDFDKIIIVAYDKNLSDYYLNSNTSLNFNKYRIPYSTVENGYGVFGAINISSFAL